MTTLSANASNHLRAGLANNAAAKEIETILESGATGGYADDVVLTLGTDDDVALVERSTALNANTALTGVLVGTPVVPAIPANSLIVANATADGDIVLATQTGGNSKAGIVVDGSAEQVVIPAMPLAFGSNATDRVTMKGMYMSPANVAVTVPAITDPDIASVDVDVSSAFSIQPAVGDVVIAIPQEAMETNCRIQSAYVTATDTIRVVFGSLGGNVTGGSKNFKFFVIDLT